MKEIYGMDAPYIELETNDIKKTSYILSGQLGLDNFKITNNDSIRIYDGKTTTKNILAALAKYNVDINFIGKKTESLEDYFLKLTEEGK